MFQCLYTYVTSVCFKFFNRFQTYIASICFKFFSCFRTFVASGLSRCCICSTGYTRTLQMYVFKCFSSFKHMLQVFYLDVAYVALTIQNAASVCFQMFSTGSNVCCKCFYLDVAMATHMLQAYVLNVSSIFETYVAANPICCKYSMSRRGKWVQTEQVNPSAVAVLAGVRSEASMVAPTCMWSSNHMCTAVVGRLARQAQQEQRAGRCGSSSIVRVAGVGGACIASVSSPVESHGCRVVSVNVVSDGFRPRTCYCYLCLSAVDVFDVIIWGQVAGAGRSVCPDIGR
jgi:hypothetical protein